MISLPLMLITSIMIKLETRGPIFFISERVGQNNKNFKMIKFRTMYLNTEIIETAKLKNHKSKVTRLGRVLRKLSIDEIPQFICVIKGQMAIVGPRPALPSQISLIKSRKKFGIDRLLPGITGFAQIRGRDLISDKEKLNFELNYLKQRSLLLDLKIIFKTIKVVISRVGIAH
jgi:O-antigen biosynthesis protein WbqP